MKYKTIQMFFPDGSQSNHWDEIFHKCEIMINGTMVTVTEKDGRQHIYSGMPFIMTTKLKALKEPENALVDTM